MSPRQPDNHQSDRGGQEREEGGDGEGTRDADHSDNEDTHSHGHLDGDRRSSDVTITVDNDKEHTTTKDEPPSFDPKQFFTQLGTLVAVFGVTVDMTQKLFGAITAQNFNAILANGLVLGLIHVPTLFALLYVLFKDKVKLAIKAAIFISKLFVKKKKSQVETGAKTLARKSDPRKFVSKLKNKGKGKQGTASECGSEGVHSSLKNEKIITQISPGKFDSVDVVAVSSKVETEYERSKDVLVSSDSDRTITPSLSDYFGERNDTDPHYHGHQYVKNEHYSELKHSNARDIVSQTSGESYQSFRETHRRDLGSERQGHRSYSRQRETTQHNISSVKDGSDVIIDDTSRHGRNSTSVSGGHQSHRNTKYHSKDGSIHAHGSSNVGGSRRSQDYERRDDHFVTNHRSHSNSRTHGSDATSLSRQNGGNVRSVSNGSRVDSNAHREHGHHSHRQERRPTDEKSVDTRYSNSRETPSGRGRSKSREVEQGSGSRHVDTFDARYVRKSKNENVRAMSSDRLNHSNQRLGTDNPGFMNDDDDDDELPVYLDTESERRTSREIKNRQTQIKTTGVADSSVRRERRGRDHVHSHGPRNNHNAPDDHSTRHSSSSDRIDGHRNNALEDADRVVNGRTRSKVRNDETESNSSQRMKGTMTTRTSTQSHSNQDPIELESDEEKILLMIRRITQEKAKLKNKKIQNNNNISHSPAPSPQRRDQQRPSRPGQNCHVEGSTVVDIEDRSRKPIRKTR